MLRKIDYITANKDAAVKGPGPETQWIFIKPNHSIVYKKPIGIRRKAGTMEINVLKDSIPIRCDGFYLFFLEGTISLQGAKAPLILRVYRDPQDSFLSINCSDQKTEVQETIVHEFRSSDEVYLQYDGNENPKNETSRQDLTLSLFMLTPHTYCYPEK
nr:tumor necrosis factor ligand superfamily member 4-like isoform X2 [Pogona vitticeps]